jgi:peptidoglycan/xylan/chitin deacetylase (PgdA/CDA1 family)
MILSYSRRRRWLYFLLYASGISGLALRLARRRQPLVLVAHRVLEVKDPAERLLVDSGAAVNKNDFERRIRFLVSHLHPVAMADYLDGTAGPNSFVLTFDDGYRDNFSIALPVLRHYGVPMHLFVTTGFVSGQAVSWVDRVSRACSTAETGRYRIASLGLELGFAAPAGRCAGFDQLCRSLKTKDLAHIEQALAEIESLPGVAPLRDCDGLFLSPSELGAADSLVSFGAHSVTHANFRLLDEDAVAAEAEDSRQWLEAATGRPVHTFAYPYGFAGDCSCDYFRQALAATAAAWRHVFGTGSGRAGDPLEDRRLNLNLQAFYVFHVEVSGAWALLGRALRR